MNPESESEIFLATAQQQSTGGQSDLRRWLAPVVIFVVAGLATLFLNKPGELSDDQAVLGLVVIGLGCAPLILYLHDVNRPPLPFLPLVGLFYVTSFGLPMFTVHLQQDNSSSLFRIEDVTNYSLWLTAGGMFAMFSMFLGAERTLLKRIRPVRIAWDGGSFALHCFIWSALAIHLLYYLLPGLQTISTVGSLAEPIGFLSWGTIIVWWLENRLAPLEKYLLAPTGIIVELMFRATTGLLSSASIFGLFVAFVIFRFRPRLAMPFAVLSIGFLVFLNPIKNAYRHAAWYGEQSNASVVQRFRLFSQLAWDYYTTEGFNPARDGNVAALSARVSTIGIFSTVVSMTPESVPYLNGATYQSLWTKWIPRFLWPGKPEERTGNDFGQRYGFVDEWDLSTSLNFPWIVELYANFGTGGVLLGMGLFGAFLALLNRLFNQPQMNPLEFVYGTTLLFGLFYQESSFALMVGNVFLLSITLYLLLNWIVGSPRSAEELLENAST